MNREYTPDEIRGLRGCITAMVTPFNEKFELDLEGLRKNIEFQINNKVSGLVILGTTGESPTITNEEFKSIVELSVNQVNGRVPVIIGTGSNSTEKTVHTTKIAEELGGDAALIVTPYYNKPTQEGIYRHFEKISNSTNIPIIIYNIAGRTGVNIDTNTMVRLSKLKNIIGVKEASGNINQVFDVIKNVPDEFLVFSGDDALTVPIMSLGGHGVISVASNIFPRKISEMTKYILEGNLKEANIINMELMPIFRDLFIETNPIPVKTAMQLLGMPAGPLRLPLCEIGLHDKDRLKSTLAQYSELKNMMIDKI